MRESLSKKKKNCPLCSDANSKLVKYIDPIWSRLSIFDKLKIRACMGCGLGYSIPELPDQKVDLFYKKYYRDASSPFYTDYNAMTENKSFDSRSVAQLLLIKQFVNLREQPVFLDIGPGSGKSFRAAKKIINNPSCVAIETNEGAASALRRVYSTTTFSSLTEFAETGQTADIILMSHVLEHFKLSWLDSFLKQMNQVIAPGGALIIEVPNVDMRQHINMRSIDSPHFIFFSKDSLRLLFEKKGWDVLFCETCSSLYQQVHIETNNTVIKKIGVQKLYDRIKKQLRKLIQGMPPLLRKIVYIIFNATKSKDLQINSDFEYCGDRTAIRLVARPQLK